MCGVSGTRETHWRRRRRRTRGGVVVVVVVAVVGGGDGSHIELGEVWRGRWREREGRGG